MQTHRIFVVSFDVSFVDKVYDKAYDKDESQMHRMSRRNDLTAYSLKAFPKLKESL